MRKIVIFILAGGLVLALGLGIIFKVKVAKLPIENVLVQDAIMYIKASEIGESLEEFRNTKLWQAIRDLDIEMLMEKSGASQDQIEQYRNFRREFFGNIAQTLLDKFFGQEVALAIYSINVDQPRPGIMDFAVSDIILVTRLKPEAQFIEFISKVYSQFAQNITTISEQYRDHKITIIKLKDKLNISYTKIKDLLIIGLNTDIVRSCLDAFNGRKPPLSKDKNYIYTRSKLPKKARVVAYGNLDLFLPNYKQLISTFIAGSEKILGGGDQLSEAFDKLSGFKTFGLSYVPGKILSNKLVWIFDKASLQLPLSKIYSFKPEKNKTIKFIPQDIVGYQWSNSFDVASIWDNWQESAGESVQRMGRPPFAELVNSLEVELGLNVENDILPAFGNETGGFLSDIDFNFLFPIPEFVYFLEVNDKSVIENIISTLTQKDNIAVQSENYKNILIKYILLPLGSNIQPSYCFIEDYLLIATNLKVLKKSIDAYNDKSLSLIEDKYFKELNFGLTKDNNSVMFLKYDILFEKVERLLKWGASWLSMIALNQKSSLEMAKQKISSAKGEVDQDKEKLENMKQQFSLGKIDPVLIKLYLDEVILPILNSLKDCKATASRAIFSEDMVEAMSYLKIED